MPSSPPSFIRYFAQTDTSAIGIAALEYAKSMLRVAPIRLVSMSGGLEGPWRRFADALLTPMTGSYVSAVCCHPSRWIWHAEVPMTSGACDEDGLPAAPKFVKAPPDEPRGLDIEMPEMQKTTEVAVGIEELYTPKVRNLLFIACPPENKQQHGAAKKYEARVLTSLNVALAISRQFPDSGFDATVLPIPVENHKTIRELVLGANSDDSGAP